MGNTFEVSELKSHSFFKDAFEYHQIYYGESLIKAMWAMWKSKRGGSGCVKLEWR